VNPLKTDVALRRPQSLDDAIMLARACEQRLQLGPSDPGHGRGGRVGGARRSNPWRPPLLLRRHLPPPPLHQHRPPPSGQAR
jgi:hypothetical protein